MIVKLTLSVLLAAGVGMAFKTGAPGAQCVTLTPGHYGGPENTPSPFGISFAPTTYTPGQPTTITVTLEKRCNERSFRGFILTARYANATGWGGMPLSDNEQPGSFMLITPGTGQVICGGKAITHVSNEEKESVNFIYTVPPVGEGGHIKFRASFVEEFSTYWVDVHSDQALMDETYGFPSDQERRDNFILPPTPALQGGCSPPDEGTGWTGGEEVWSGAGRSAVESVVLVTTTLLCVVATILY